jgi:hypothetical protein
MWIDTIGEMIDPSALLVVLVMLVAWSYNVGTRAGMPDR